MGIERARVVEVRARAGAGSGYLVGDRLVLTAAGVAGRSGPAEVRPAGTGRWVAASVVWSGASGGAVLDVDDPSSLMASPDRMPWGRVSGRRPVAVMAMGFGPSAAPADWPRDADRFVGHVALGPAGDLTVTASPVSAPATAGMSGAALFAGAEVVGILLGGDRPRAVPSEAMAADPGFAALFGDRGLLALVPVTAPASGFPIL